MYLGSRQLFSKYYTRTYVDIENYLDAASSIFVHINEKQFFSNVTLEDKLQCLTECKQALGQTALVLAGGSTFGLMHLGIVKSLFEQKLLPKVIMGSSVGNISEE
jgi:predicted acylesterase/phospholipase RssA